MPKLTLMLKKFEKKLMEYYMERGDSITIGRKEENYIVIDNLAVSGRHAKIDSVGDDFLLTDLQSKNGTLVNDKPVTSHWLKDGDLITIGKHAVLFSWKDKDDDEEPESKMDQTVVIDPEKMRELIAQQQTEKPAAAAAPPQQKVEEIGVLSFLSGGEGEIELSKKLTKIGKNKASDIVVGGIMMGQTAATISKRPNGFYLDFVGGMTKPKLNGDTVKDSAPLKPFDIIEVGSAKMQFFIK